jgi:hypothetical protein
VPSDSADKIGSLRAIPVFPLSEQSVPIPFAARSISVPLQRKLSIGATNDPLEVEADQMAEHVLSMPVQAPPSHTSSAQTLHRKCSCQGSGSQCKDCEDEANGHKLRRKESDKITPIAAPPIVHDVLRSPGQSLDATTRAYFEQRFGEDFSGVRVHYGSAAEQSAGDVNARAYTVGHDIVFGAGRFAPSTQEGRRLLAHELAHVVQQSDSQKSSQIRGEKIPALPSISSAQNVVQRKCLNALGSPNPDCVKSQQGVGGWQFQFKVGCDELLPGEESKISKLKPGRKLNIHGFASREGEPGFNEELSCHRANVILALAQAQRPDCPVLGRFKHGASPAATPAGTKDANPADFWRSVIIEEVRPTPGEWLDPSSMIAQGWQLYTEAKNRPTQSNLDAAAARRLPIKAWLEGIPKSLAPAGAQLDRKDLTDYRQFYTSAESLWTSIDKLLADQGYASADSNTHDKWAAGSGTDSGPELHAHHVPPGARYHIDLFGEGFFPGAVNIGMAERTSTTGVPGTRVPNLIYRQFAHSNAATNRLPIADHVADVVTSENGPLMDAGLIDEIARIIAPGGTILLYGPTNMEKYHDQMAKVVGGTITKEIKNGGIESIIRVPGP